MNDEKYSFVEDVIDRSSVARSARHHNTKRGGAKLPSDYLSRKEVEKLHGDVKSYRLNEPMKWAEFKELPDDVKVLYITALRDKFGAPDAAIAEMMGVSDSMVSFTARQLGVANQNKRNAGWDKDGFIAWREGLPYAPAESADEKPIEQPVTIYKNVNRKQVLARTGKVQLEGDTDSIIDLLRTILGGCNISLYAEWDVAPSDSTENRG